MNIKIQNINYHNFFIFLTLFGFFFLWDLNNHFFYLIILPITLFFFKKENYKFKKKNIFLLLFICLIIVYLTLNPYKLININLEIISDLLGLFLVIIFCKFFRKEIILNIKNLVIIFSIIYFGLNVLDLVINYSLFSISDINFLNYKRCHYSTGFFRTNIIFSENSHFGMVSVAVSYYLFYLISVEKRNFLRIILLLFVLSFIYNSSTTYILGYILSFFAIQICCYKKTNKQFFLLTTSFLIIIIVTLIISSSCLKRFQDLGQTSEVFKKIYNLNNVNANSEKIEDTSSENIEDIASGNILVSQNDLNRKFNEIFTEYYELYKQLSNLTDNLISNEKKKKDLQERLIFIEKKLNKFDKEKFDLMTKNFSLNLTTQVYLRSFYVLLEAIKEKPFGWGLNNYYLASKEYRFTIPFLNPQTIFLNTHDASNNFVKLITEFGVFGLFLLILITFICLNKDFDYKVKIFFMPLIITQLIRGAGYFNGGFLIGICIIIILFIYKD